MRLVGCEATEAPFEIAQRNHHANCLQSPARSGSIVALEVLGEPFVQPRGDAARYQARDDRVRELVSQHALEELWALRGARRRHADAAIVDAARPFGRQRDVAELFLGVEHHHDRVRRIRAECLADSPER